MASTPSNIGSFQSGSRAVIRTKTVYDANGRVVALIDDRGAQTIYTYDLLDRQTSMTFQDGSTRTSVYDLANDVIAYTDENGSAFANVYDPLGRRTATAITPATGVVGTTAQRFQYDGLSRMTFARDSVSSTNADVTFYYDSLHRMVEEVQTDIRSPRSRSRTSCPKPSIGCSMISSFPDFSGSMNAGDVKNVEVPMFIGQRSTSFRSVNLSPFLAILRRLSSTLVFLLVFQNAAVVDANEDDLHWDNEEKSAVRASLRGKLADAELHFKAALTTAEGFPENDPRLRITMEGLAHVYSRQSRYSDAIDLYRRSLNLAESNSAMKPDEVTHTLLSLAGIKRFQGRYNEAAELYARVVVIEQKAVIPGQEREKLTSAHLGLAMTYAAMSKNGLAECEYRRAVEIAERLWGIDAINVANRLIDLALFEMHISAFNKAEPLFKRAFEIDAKALGPEQYETARAEFLLAEFYRKTDQLEKAMPHYQHVFSISESVFGAWDLDMVDFLLGFAKACETKGMTGTAITLVKRALSICDVKLPATVPEVHEVLEIYGRLLERTGKTKESLDVNARLRERQDRQLDK